MPVDPQTERTLFPLQREGNTLAKWYVYELRFSCRLTRTQQRHLEAVLRRVGAHLGSGASPVGEDGVAPTQWDDKYPEELPLERLTRSLRGFPSARIRAAALGSQCARTPHLCYRVAEGAVTCPGRGYVGECIPDLSTLPWIRLENDPA